MATVHIVLAGVSNRATAGNQLPVPDAESVSADTLTSSATSQQASISVPDLSTGFGLFWSITASGGDVWVLFGADPTAVAESGWLIVDGQTREFGAKASQKVAVIDV